jgi:hypothetical protein
MTCNEIENRLPAYRENLLSPEDRKIIAGHLNSCHICSRAFAGLKKAEALVHGLGEVEPPPFFEQKIMSRVREEAGKKQGILRRLFYPLHIKIPIQALATLLVAVLTFYVYQGGDPEMKAMAPFPIPLTDPGKDRIVAEAPKTPLPPSAFTPIEQVPARDLSEKDQQRFATPPLEETAKEEKAGDLRAMAREGRPSAIQPPDPVTTATEKRSPPAGSEGLSRMADRAEKKDTDKAFETLAQELKWKARMNDTGAGVRESAKKTPAPSPSRMTAAAAISKRPAVDLTIRVRDTDVAIREIERCLGRVNARIVERQDRKGSEFLKAEMAAQNIAALLELLEAVGKINLETSPLAASEGDVLVSIKIVVPP